MSDGTYRPELDITNYVGKFREMDPKTEDLIADGHSLANGMRVLIASAYHRVDVSRGFGDPNASGINGLDLETLDKAKEINRWCTVSKLSYKNEHVSFVATYDDDTKRKRTYHCHFAWLVKLDSMPKTDEKGDANRACAYHKSKCACDHPIDLYAPHCSVPGCHNYAGGFIRG